VCVDSKSDQPRTHLKAVVFVAPALADVAGEAVSAFYVQIQPLPWWDQVADREFELALHRGFQSVREHRMVAT
jgi:hypothetical protein